MNAIKNFLEGLQGKPEGSSNAIDILKEDHAKVKQMMEKFLNIDNEKEKAALLKGIIEELTIHTELEEELIYPIVKEESSELILESIEEHRLIKILLGELSDLNAGDTKVRAKVKVLNELLKKHIDSEEGETFPELEKMEEDLDELGQEVMHLKEELKEGMVKKRIGKKRTTRHTTKSKTTGIRTKSAASRSRAKAAGTTRSKSRSSSSSRRKPVAASRRKSSSTAKKSAASTARSKSAASTNRKRSARARRRVPTRKAS